MLAAGAVVEAVPVPTATAQRLVDAQQRSEELEALLEDKFRSLGEPGIARPKDVLLFVNDLVYKENANQRIAAHMRVLVLQHAHHQHGRDPRRRPPRLVPPVSSSCQTSSEAAA